MCTGMMISATARVVVLQQRQEELRLLVTGVRKRYHGIFMYAERLSLLIFGERSLELLPDGVPPAEMKPVNK